MSAIWTPPAIGPRLHAWERAALAVLSHHLRQPFAWGVSDCLTVPADLAEAMCGVVVLPAHLRRYRSAEGAQKLLFKCGFADVEEALAAVFPRIPSARAMRFDAGVLERRLDGRPVLSTVIVSSGGQALGRDETGPIAAPVLGLRATFSIGAR